MTSSRVFTTVTYTVSSNVTANISQVLPNTLIGSVQSITALNVPFEYITSPSSITVRFCHNGSVLRNVSQTVALLDGTWNTPRCSCISSLVVLTNGCNSFALACLMI